MDVEILTVGQSTNTYEDGFRECAEKDESYQLCVRLIRVHAILGVLIYLVWCPARDR